MASTIRFGILGAAWIAPMALIRPARQLTDVVIAAVAARDEARAHRFARRHGIARVHDSYAELIHDPAIDAIYVPLPNSLHARWTILALEAGKHVLCEKPLAANANEAQIMADVAVRTGCVLAEAMHYRYHPLANRLRDIVRREAFGRLEQLTAYACVPIFRGRDIRYQYELGGGALMDLGCYAIDLLRLMAGSEPEVISAEALLAGPAVDRAMRAELRFASGGLGHMVCSMWSRDFLRAEARARGRHGSLKVVNPYAPHWWHSLRWSVDGRKHREKIRRGETTYFYQLRAFVEAVRHGSPLETDAANAVATLRVIDAIYRRAGLPPRGLAPEVVGLQR